MMLHFARFKRAGFTLIEIMIVVAIIAILAGIVVPNFVEARQESYLQACKKNILTIVQAVECAGIRYSQAELCTKGAATGSYSEIGSFLIENGYITSPPICPIASVIDEPSLCGSYNVRIFLPGTGSYNICSGYVLCYNSHVVGGNNGRLRYVLGGKGAGSGSSMYGYGWTTSSQ